MGAIHDAHHLRDEMVQDLSTLAGEGSDHFIRSLEAAKAVPSDLWSKKYFWKDRNLIRKLSLVSDPEAKERVIAIFDYWSQTVLRPLHDSLMDFVGRIPGDCTYSQQGSSRYLPNTGPYYSMDLTAATDRYPVKLQSAVLGKLVDSTEYADAWSRTMVHEPFANPWGDPVHYARGQPMGAYSSWAMFALCHHLTVRTAARLAGLNPRAYTQYALLGDDIVLTNPLVADKYQYLMGELDVELSSSKTHMSQDMWEFAKRWYQAGIELSGIQLHTFANISKWPEASEALRTSLSRWTIDPSDMDPGSIPAYLEALGLRIRDAHKVSLFLSFPLRGESAEIRKHKVIYITERFYPGLFGCFDRLQTREVFVLQSLAEIKTALMEQGIREVFKKSNAFLQTEIPNLSLELPDHEALSLLPVFATVRSQAQDLQKSFDSLRTAYYNSDEDGALAQVIGACSDPTRIMVKRQAKMVMAARVTLLYNYKNMAPGYMNTYYHVLDDVACPPDSIPDEGY
jgi:hypothetical protein